MRFYQVVFLYLYAVVALLLFLRCRVPLMFSNLPVAASILLIYALHYVAILSRLHYILFTP